MQSEDVVVRVGTGKHGGEGRIVRHPGMAEAIHPISSRGNVIQPVFLQQRS